MADTSGIPAAVLEAQRAFGDELRRLRNAKGLSQPALARLVNYSEDMISRAENATRRFPSPEFAQSVDTALGAGGRLIAMHAKGYRPRGATRRRPADSEADNQGQGDTTNRRQALAAAGAATVGEAIQALADRVALADPTPLSVAQIRAEVGRAGEAMIRVPQERLRAELAPKHLAVEALLDRRLSRRVRDELTIYAGQYCIMLSWLAHSTFNDSGALAYHALASHHAAESGEPRLASATVELHTSLVGDAAAADIAAIARVRAHPYIAPMLAAKEAVGAALVGDPVRSRRALADMERDIWHGPLLPGGTFCFNDEHGHYWSAKALNAMGEGEAAEGHVRASLSLTEGTGEDVLLASSYGVLAQSYLRRRRPEPVQAATAAFMDLRTRPSRVSLDRAVSTWRQLAGRWGNLPAVRDLGELVASTRAALPAAAASV